MHRLRNLLSPIVDGIARVLVKLGFSPSGLTVIGVLIACVAAALISQGMLAIGGIVMLIAGVFDMFDGAVARMTDRATKFGALFDSVMDRVSEAVVLLGLLWFYLEDGEQLGAVLVYVSIVGSTLVSYVRARAEGTGHRVQGRADAAAGAGGVAGSRDHRGPVVGAGGADRAGGHRGADGGDDGAAGGGDGARGGGVRCSVRWSANRSFGALPNHSKNAVLQLLTQLFWGSPDYVVVVLGVEVQCFHRILPTGENDWPFEPMGKSGLVVHATPCSVFSVVKSATTNRERRSSAMISSSILLTCSFWSILRGLYPAF